MDANQSDGWLDWRRSSPRRLTVLIRRLKLGPTDSSQSSQSLTKTHTKGDFKLNSTVTSGHAAAGRRSMHRWPSQSLWLKQPAGQQTTHWGDNEMTSVSVLFEVVLPTAVKTKTFDQRCFRTTARTPKQWNSQSLPAQFLTSGRHQYWHLVLINQCHMPQFCRVRKTQVYKIYKSDFLFV